MILRGLFLGRVVLGLGLRTVGSLPIQPSNEHFSASRTPRSAMYEYLLKTKIKRK